MLKKDKITNILFQNWLTLNLILVFSMIIVGGLTRLTDSGLSITEWELFKGIFPPMSDTSWNDYFESYKKIPQYELLNQNMTLGEFKIIFLWEYFHRILGRIIGLFFLVPLIYFNFFSIIEKKYLFLCNIIFILILVQGLIGWYMVQSGLVNDVTVSHYRLAMHLVTAIIIISSIYWLLLNLKHNRNKSFFNFNKINSPFIILIFLIFLQIIFGAFVSGLDAGKIYQTWPKMGDTFFPNDLVIINFLNIVDFDNHSLVQFYHRALAYFITMYITITAFYIFYKKMRKLFKYVLVVFIFLVIQILLGIFTLISGLNIYLASAHQISSILLVFSTIKLYYFSIK